MNSTNATALQACIDACFGCAVACETCATACLEEADVQMMVGCIRLDRDCADICRLTGTLMSRGSEYGVQMAEVCASICDACAEECSQHQHEHCQRCAEACRRCADECRRMIAGG